MKAVADQQDGIQIEAEPEDDSPAASLLEADSYSIGVGNVTVQRKGKPLAIRFERKESHDVITVNGLNNVSFADSLQVTNCLSEYFPPLLGNLGAHGAVGEQLDAYYQNREAALAKLEELNQRLIESGEKRVSAIEEEAAKKRAVLEEEYQAKTEELREQHKEAEAQVNSRVAELDERERELDDQATRDARRKNMRDLMERVKGRLSDFSVTETTQLSRMGVSRAFMTALSILLSALVALVLIANLPPETSPLHPHLPYLISGLSLSITLLAIWWIRWQMSWFRRCSDEEFRLHRLQLDLERASWVAELALEWREISEPEDRRELPDVLAQNFTAGLFDSKGGATVPHPAEQLASLLVQASKVDLDLPGVQARIEGKNIRKPVDKKVQPD